MDFFRAKGLLRHPVFDVGFFENFGFLVVRTTRPSAALNLIFYSGRELVFH
jgi:hypothetical protein